MTEIEGIEELHNKIMYLEERLNQLNQQHEQPSQQPQPQQPQSIEKHSNIFDKIECPTCHKTFANKYVLKTHIAQKHTETQRERYKCQHCGKSFLSAYYLKYHLSRLHPDEK